MSGKGRRFHDLEIAIINEGATRELPYSEISAILSECGFSRTKDGVGSAVARLRGRYEGTGDQRKRAVLSLRAEKMGFYVGTAISFDKWIEANPGLKAVIRRGFRKKSPGSANGSAKSRAMVIPGTYADSTECLVICGEAVDLPVETIELLQRASELGDRSIAYVARAALLRGLGSK